MDEIFGSRVERPARIVLGQGDWVDVGGFSVQASNYGFTVDGYTVFAHRSVMGILFLYAKKGDETLKLEDLVGKELAPYAKIYLITSRPNERMQPDGLHLTINIAGMTYGDTSKLTDPRNFTSKYLRTVFNGTPLKERIMAMVRSEFAGELASSHSRLCKKAEQAEKISAITGVQLPNNWPGKDEMMLLCYNANLGSATGMAVGPMGEHKDDIDLCR